MKKIYEFYKKICTVILTLGIFIYFISNISEMFFNTEIEVTKTVLGYRSMAVISGMTNILLVGDIENNRNYEQGIPVYMTEVYVNNLEKYPLGSKVTFKCYKKRSILGGYSAGRIVNDPEELTDIWGGKPIKRNWGISRNEKL